MKEPTLLLLAAIAATLPVALHAQAANPPASPLERANAPPAQAVQKPRRVAPAVDPATAAGIERATRAVDRPGTTPETRATTTHGPRPLARTNGKGLAPPAVAPRDAVPRDATPSGHGEVR